MQVPIHQALPQFRHSRVDLALEHQVRRGARQGGDAPDAGRVTNAEAQALAEAEMVLGLLRS